MNPPHKSIRLPRPSGPGRHAAPRSRPPRRSLRVLLVLGAAAAAVGLTVPGALADTTAPAGTAASGSVVWAAASSSVANLADVNSGLAARDLGAKGSLIQATAPISKNPVKSGYAALPTERWASEAAFAKDAAAGKIPSYIRVAHYDNEKWSQTPVVEQHNPASYEKAFCQVAHAHGLKCATGPARDICSVAFPGSGSNNSCYLDHNLAGAAARYADYTDIQGQGNEPRGTSAYAAFISAAAAQAKAANPGNITLGNLSATPGGQSVSAATLNACARAVFGTGTGKVAGFYTTITDAGAATMASFLQLFEP